MNLSLYLAAFMALLTLLPKEYAQKSKSTLPDPPGIVITHLTGDVYIYTTYNSYNGEAFPSNSMYVLTDKGAVLFDTPWDTTQFQPLLDSIKVRHNTSVVLCISTHYHDDRTAGLAFFGQQGIKTYSSKQTYDLCKIHHKPQSSSYFSADTTFMVGNYRFQTYYAGEGHSKDNIVIWLPEEKVLYGGCLIKSTESQDMGNLADANLAAWPATIRKLMKQFPSPQYVIPGHQSWADRQSLSHTLRLLEAHKKKK